DRKFVALGNRQQSAIVADTEKSTRIADFLFGKKTPDNRKFGEGHGLSAGFKVQGGGSGKMNAWIDDLAGRGMVPRPQGFIQL
ncbi:MAG: hypothetical protein LUQ57_04735, partial [Methylococcaceae bacterium]|nr:hypothetical protein [Methylococcaceae bacterium]